MKLVVQAEPNVVSLVLDDLTADNFIIDQDAYCHFRDNVFMGEMQSFIEKVAPGKWHPK